MDFSPPLTIDGGYNVSSADNSSGDNLDNLKQVISAKPPRHLSAVRHCVSSVRLLTETNLVRYFLFFYAFGWQFSCLFSIYVKLEDLRMILNSDYLFAGFGCGGCGSQVIF